MKIYSARNLQEQLAWNMMHKSLDNKVWVKICVDSGSRMGLWYVKVLEIIEAQPVNPKYFAIRCMRIPAGYVDNYCFEGEEDAPSQSATGGQFDSWNFQVAQPVEFYTEEDMDEILLANDHIYREGYHDWWGEYPRIED